MASSISKETHVQGTKTIEAIFFLSKTRFPLFSLKIFWKQYQEHIIIFISLTYLTGKYMNIAGKFINSPETSSSPARSADSGESQNAPI
jgi:hypothetical protein